MNYNNELFCCYNQYDIIKMDVITMNSYDDEIVFNKYLDARKNDNSKHNKSLKSSLEELVGDVFGKTILDLGCGIGEFSKHFSDNGAKCVVGIDISKKVLEYAKENNNSDNIEYINFDIKNLSNLNRKFDIVFSDIVFNYIEDFNKLMHDINNLLEDDGVVVFSQVHPISTASSNIESAWTEDENGNLKFLLDSYSNISIRKRKYFDGIFNFYHRRFEEIINISIANNFRVVKIVEPYYTEKEFNRPSFLIVKLIKNKENG